MLTRTQQPNKRADAFVTEIQNLACAVPVDYERLLCCAIIKGLLPDIKPHMLQSSSNNLKDVVSQMRQAEAAIAATRSTASRSDKPRWWKKFFSAFHLMITWRPLISRPVNINGKSHSLVKLIIIKHILIYGLH